MNILKIFRKLSACFVMVTMICANFIFVQSVTAKSLDIDSYVEDFYNKYSKQFDRIGFRYSAPGYGVTHFKEASTARELMSIASYYKYRAQSGDNNAKKKIREALLEARAILNSKPASTQSFEDAIAQFLMIQMIEEVPGLTYESTKEDIRSEIAARVRGGILAKDTSNRAAIAASYWQYLINFLYEEGNFTNSQKEDLNKLNRNKIDRVIAEDIDKNSWYLEGNPNKFNPHYHTVTAFSLLSFGDLTGNKYYKEIASKMTRNLRAVTFKNGMIEARIGDRPVGIGAQIYLGAGVLNYASGSEDYKTYLNYGSNGRFFSDTVQPNRLEYHSTLEGTNPEFHDDISFSNLAELALAIPVTNEMVVSYKSEMNDVPVYSKGSKITVFNHSDVIWVNDKKFTLGSYGNWSKIDGIHLGATETIFDSNIFKGSIERNLFDSDEDGLDDDEERMRWTNPYDRDSDNDGISDGHEIREGYNPKSSSKQRVSYDRSIYYGKSRLPRLEEEAELARHLKLELEKYYGTGKIPISDVNWHIVVNSYIYGRYTVDEIYDTIEHGPNAVHPNIEARFWRNNSDYRHYLNRL